jgi:hypothetical protein
MHRYEEPSKMRARPVLSITLLSFVLLAAVAVAEDGDIPRTRSGKPDLSGTYDIANLTPFERDPKYDDQKVMPPEDAEAIAQRMAGFSDLLAKNSDPNRAAPPAGGDGSAGPSGKVGGYNFFWIDMGTQLYPIDGEYRTSVLYDPPNGRLPPLSEAGKLRRKDHNPYSIENTGDADWLESGADPYDGPESLSGSDRCLYVGVATVPAISVPYNNLKKIVQTDTHVAILVEWMHWARVIRLDSEHLPGEVRSLSGDSIGRWEGDTLVVDTTNFHPLAGMRGGSEQMHVVERFSRLDDGNLLYTFTVEDPTVWTAPWTGEYVWRTSDEQVYEYACHEGNYAMEGILRGARLLEAEAQAGKTGADTSSQD